MKDCVLEYKTTTKNPYITHVYIFVSKEYMSIMQEIILNYTNPYD